VDVEHGWHGVVGSGMGDGAGSGDDGGESEDGDGDKGGIERGEAGAHAGPRLARVVRGLGAQQPPPDQPGG